MLKKRAEEGMRIQKMRICGFENLIAQWQKTFSGTFERQSRSEMSGATGEEVIAIEKEVRRFRDLL